MLGLTVTANKMTKYDIKKYTLEQEHLNRDETGRRTLATRW